MEREGRADPAALTRMLGRWVWVGHGLILALFALIVAIGAAPMVALYLMRSDASQIVVLSLMIALGIVVVGIAALDKIWHKSPRVVGVPVTAREAPALFAVDEAVRGRVGARRSHSVRLVDNGEAFLATQRRLRGVFGEERHLLIGVPGLNALTPELLEVFVARELMRGEGADARLARRLERAWVVWNYFDERSRVPGRRIPVIDDVARWYVRRLSMLVLAHRRVVESTLDGLAARATDPSRVARALVTAATTDFRTDRAWSALYRAAIEHETPPKDAWSTVLPVVRSGPAEGEDAFLSQLFVIEELVDDQRPAVATRVRALGIAAPVRGAADFVAPAGPGASAAERLLPEVFTRRIAELDAEYHEQADREWSSRRERLAELRAERDAILAREAAGETLAASQISDLGWAITNVDGDEAAEPLYRRALMVDPDNLVARFQLGRLLLARRDREGVEHMKRAMELDVGVIQSGSALLRNFHAMVGDADAAIDADLWAAPHFDRLREADEERRYLLPTDEYAPPEISRVDRQRLLAIDHPSVGRIWLAMKKTRHSTDLPLLVAVVRGKSAFTIGTAEQLAASTQLVYDALNADEAESAKRSVSVFWLMTNEAATRRMRDQGAWVVIPSKQRIAPAGSARWERFFERASLWGGLAIVAAVFIYGFVYTPYVVVDPHGVVDPAVRREWDELIYRRSDDLNTDAMLLIDSAPPVGGVRWAQAEQARLLEGDTSSYSLFIAYDLRTGDVPLVFGNGPARKLPNAFVDTLRARARRQATLAGHPLRVLPDVFTVLFHRMQESSLRPRITYVERRVVPTPMSDEEISPATTAADALARFRALVQRAAFDPRTQVLTPESRADLAEASRTRPLAWAHWRHLYAEEPMGLVVRGDLALAFAWGNPLVPPLFLRREATGWQVDLRAAEVEVAPMLHGGYAWEMTGDGPHGRAFRDLLTRRNGYRRITGADNSRF